MMSAFRAHDILQLVLWICFIVFVQSLKVQFSKNMIPSVKNRQFSSTIAIEKNPITKSSLPTFQYVSNNIYINQRKYRIKAVKTTTTSLSLMTPSSPTPNKNVMLSSNGDSNNNDKNFDKNSLRLYLEFVPLIGGPPFLPIHVKVVLEKTYPSRTDISKNDVVVDSVKYKFDFIPQNATEQSTITKLLQLQYIPGLIRCQDENKKTILKEQTKLDRKRQSPLQQQQQQQQQQIDDCTVVQKAFDFCDNYANSNLHLILNNCWTFALPLYLHLYSYMSLQQQQRNVQ